MFSLKARGETGAVNAAVRAGADACERVGDGLVAAHIIARNMGRQLREVKVLQWARLH